MTDPDPASPARLKRKALTALAIGAAGLALAAAWLPGLRGDGAVHLLPGTAAVHGREAIATVVGVGATGLAFCVYGAVLAWVARRIRILRAHDDGDET